MYNKVLSVLTAKIASDIAGYVDHFRYAPHKKTKKIKKSVPSKVQ